MLRDHLPAERAHVPLRARAHVTQEAHGYRLDIELGQGGQGAMAQRTLRNAHCAQLAEAAVVLIGLAVRAAEPASSELPAPTVPAPVNESAPEATASERARETPGRAAATRRADATMQPSAAAGATTPEPSDAASGVSRGPSAPLHLQLSAAARTAVGVFPGALALGAQAQIAARVAPLYAALGLSYWFPSEARSSSYPRAMLRGSGLFADVGLGADVPLPSLVLTPAFCLELGQLHARAVGVNGPESSRTLWLAAGASLSLSYSIDRRWMIALDAAGLSPLTRIRWLVRAPGGDVEAFSAAPFTARVGLRVGYTLW